MCEEYRPASDGASRGLQVNDCPDAPPSTTEKCVRPTAGAGWEHSLRPDLATVEAVQPPGVTPLGFFASDAMESESVLLEPLEGDEPEPEDENLVAS